MIRIVVLAALWLLPGLSYAQEIISRQSNPLPIPPGQVKAQRTQFLYSQVKWLDDDRSGSIEPGEHGFVCFTITNPTGADSQRLYIIATLAEPVPGLQVTGMMRLHPVYPGKALEVRVPVQATGDLLPAIATLLIEIREANVFDSDMLQVQLLTSGGISAKTK
jgi:hypothetical protein